jgi:signal transduction histidine kinase
MAIAYDNIRFLALRNKLISLQGISSSISAPTTQQKIMQEIDEIQALINDILNSSTQILEIAQQKKSVVDLATILNTLCNDPQITPYVSFTSNISQAPCLADPLVLKRVFNNLIHNAVKYGKLARVTLTRQENKILINIDDKGPGIPENEMTEVFKPFYRASNIRNTQTEGSGIGLAFAKLAILLYNGSIKLYNLHPGLRVSVTLNYVNTSHQAIHPPTMAANESEIALISQAYTIKSAALSHDLLNLITRVRLRMQMAEEDPIRKRKIENILEELEALLRHTLTSAKQNYQS